MLGPKQPPAASAVLVGLQACYEDLASKAAQRRSVISRRHLEIYEEQQRCVTSISGLCAHEQEVVLRGQSADGKSTGPELRLLRDLPSARCSADSSPGRSSSELASAADR